MLAKVEAWLFSEFAFVVAEANESTSPDDEEERLFHADRYGSTAGASPHGGSGRVATVGRFQVKGVGATPLVGATRAAGHAHGYLSLAEALREAIFSEIIAAEFPHGATPVVAVLVVGKLFSSPDATERFDQAVPRALLIRPAVVRVAHMERAFGFRVRRDGTPQRPDDDIQRVRDVVCAWSERSSATDECRGMLPLQELVANIARQVAYGHAHRISFGGVFTSNIGGRGQLMDFGNVHFLPDWSHALVLPHVPGFGAEMKGLRAAIRSICAVSRAHGIANEENDAGSLWFHAQEAYHERLDREWSRLWGSGGAGHEEIAAIMNAYVAFEQMGRVLYRFGERVSSSGRVAAHLNLHTALHDYLNGASADPVDTSEGERLIASMAVRLPARALADARRWVCPRTSVDRRALLEESHALCQGTIEPGRMSRFVDRVIGLARRDWQDLPDGWSIDAHIYHQGDSALWCRDQEGRPRLWLDGSQENDQLSLFGQVVQCVGSSRSQITNSQGRWQTDLPAVAHLEASDQIDIMGTVIRLPTTPQSQCSG